MNKLAKIFVGAMAALALGVYADNEAVSFRFAQWNIGHFAHGTSSSPVVGYSNVADWNSVIEDLDADVLGLCEYHSTMYGGDDTIQSLGADYADFNVGSQHSYNWNAVWVKSGLGTRISQNEYKFSSATQYRYWIDVTYLIDGKSVHFVETHLDWNQGTSGASCRAAQISEIIGFYDNTPYVVLSADWNIDNGAQEWEDFELAGYELANPSDPAYAFDTFCGSTTDKPLDNIIVKGFEISDVTTSDDFYELSDHRPLACTLTFVPEQEEEEEGDQLDITMFDYRTPITIDGYLGASTLENYPVLLRLPDISSNDFRIASENGINLPFDVEGTDASGKLLVWVKVPVVRPPNSENGPTTLTVYSGIKSGETPPANDSTEVWSNYAGVWHMNEDSTSQTDSTGNGLTANCDSGVTVELRDGMIGKSVYKSGRMAAADFFASGHDYTTSSRSYTVSGWYYWPDYVASVNKNQNPFQKGTWQQHSWYAQHKSDANSPLTTITAIFYSNTYRVPVNNINQYWNFVTFTYDGTNFKIYVNGSNTPALNETRNLTAGTYAFVIGTTKGYADETRVMRGVASGDWSKADYMQAGTDFLTVGTKSVNNGKILIDKPVLEPASAIWNGCLQRPTVVEKTGYIVNWGSGNYTDIGSYTITCSLTDPTTCSWDDGTTADIVFTYTITPLPRPITINCVNYNEGEPVSVDLSFPVSDKCALLYCLSGSADGYTTEANWDSVEYIGPVYAGDTTATVPYPENFTDGVLRYALVDADYPTEFLDYVYANGAWLNTGIYAESPKTCTVIDFKFVDDVRAQDRILESRTSEWTAMPSSVLQYEIYVNGNGYGAAVCRTGGQNSSNGTTASKIGKNRSLIVLDAKRKFFSWYGSTVTANFNAANGLRSELPITLFKNASKSARGNLYACSITNDDVCVRDFVPAKLGNKVGMFDLVESKFYESSSATAFTEGNTVTRSYTPNIPMEPIGLSDAISPSSGPVAYIATESFSDNSATFSWVLGMTGSASTAALSLVYGTDADSLDESVSISASASTDASGTVTVNNLIPGTTYYFAISVDNGVDDTFTSDLISITMHRSVEISSCVTDNAGAVNLGWHLYSVPQGGSTADVYIALGYSSDALIYTNLVSGAAIAGATGEYANGQLKVGRAAYAKIFARGTGDAVVEGNVVSFTTSDHRADDTGIGRTVTIANTERSAGVITAIDLEFGNENKGLEYDLYVAYQNRNAGEDVGAWNYVKLGTVTDETNGWHFADMPAGWGTDAFAMRFFLASESGSFRYNGQGLFALWDGIENAGRGVHGDMAHLTDGAWTDLISGIELGSSNGYVEYRSNGVYIPGGDDSSWGRCLTGTDPRPLAAVKSKAYTVELALTTGPHRQYAGVFKLGGADIAEHMLVLNQDGTDSDGNASVFYALQYRRNTWDSEHATGTIGYANTNVTATITVDENGANLYIDGEYKHTTVGGSFDTSNQSIYLGVYANGRPSPLMTFHSVRMYNRALSQEEIAANARVDAERFYGATPSELPIAAAWSPTVYWTDPNSLAVEAEADGHFGDKIRVSGNVVIPPTATASQITANLYTGSAVDIADRDVTQISLAQDGSFSCDVNVTPGSTVYWTVEATDGEDEVSTSANATVTAPAGSALSNAMIENSVTSVTLHGALSQLGANTTYVWAEWGFDPNELVRGTEPVTFDRNSQNLSFVLNGTLTRPGSLYWRVVCSNDCDSAFWTDATPVAQYEVIDSLTYTWKADVTSGNWEDPANWTVASDDSLGYPSANSIAVFPAATTAEVSFVSSNIEIGKVNCAANDLKVTFTGGRDKAVTAVYFDIRGQRGEICIKDLTFNNRNVTGYGSDSGIAWLLNATSPGNGRTFRVDNANFENWNRGNYFIVGNDVHMIIENGGYLYAYATILLGGADSTIVIDDSEVNIQGPNSVDSGVFIGRDLGGGTMTFRGKNARLRTCGVIRNCGGKAPGAMRFVVPEGGFTYPVVEQTNKTGTPANAEFANRGKTQDYEVDPIAFVIDPESPGLRSKDAFETTLVVWYQGIALDHLDRSSGMPRANRNHYIYAAERTAPFNWTTTWESATSPKALGIQRDKARGMTVIFY